MVREGDTHTPLMAASCSIAREEVDLRPPQGVEVQVPDYSEQDLEPLVMLKNNQL